MLPLADLARHPIIPEPQRAEFGPGEVRLPAQGLTALVPASHAWPTVASELAELFGGKLSVVRVARDADAPLPQAAGYILVGSPSENRAVARALDEARLPLQFGCDSPEAYLLAAGRDAAGRPRIILSGRTEAGDFYAVQSLRQLLRPQADGWSLAEAVVRDWPTFRYRGIKRQVGWPQWMPAWKMNLVWLFSREGGWQRYPLLPDGPEKAAARADAAKALSVFRARFMHPIISYNPGHVLDATEAGVARVRTMYEEWYDAGFRLFALSFDDQRSELTPETAARHGAYPKAQAAFINAVYDALQRKEKGLDLYLCHQRYASSHLAGREADARALREGGLNPGVKLQWVGPTLVAAEATARQAREFAEPFGLRNGLFYDNWPGSANSAWHLEFGPVRGRAADLSTEIDILMLSPEHVTSRVDGYAVAQIACLTAADYAWNSAAYDPRRSISRALLEYSGPQAYEPVTRFVAPFASHWLGDPDREMPVPGSEKMTPDEVSRAFDAETARLKSLLDQARPVLRDKRLLADLDHYLAQVRGEYWRKVRDASFRQYRIPQIEAPAIGRGLDDPAWRRAARVDTFFLFNKGDPDPAGTRAYVGYDTRHLYLAVECPLRPGREFVETPDNSWRSDNLQVFFDTNLDKATAERSFYLKSNNIFVNSSRNASAADRVRHAVTKAADRYVYELAIPIEYLGATAVPGTKWGMLVARSEFKADPAQNQHVYGATWCLAADAYARAVMFAEVTFE